MQAGTVGQEPQQQAFGEQGGPSGPRAGFWTRFGASLVDSIIVGVPLGILSAVVSSDAAVALLYIALIAYYVVLEGGPTGQTIGKRALGLRVISIADGSPIGYGRALIRYVGRILSSIPFFLGYFWMLWDGEKQTWHDKLASSVVVPASTYPASRG